MQQIIEHGEQVTKPLIIVNPKGRPLVPSQNQWLVALKKHAVRLMDISKSIDCQNKEKLEQLKENLEKLFDYTKPGMDCEHMRVTCGRFMKTKRWEWHKIYVERLRILSIRFNVGWFK
jgi:hypothetical protein